MTTISAPDSSASLEQTFRLMLCKDLNLRSVFSGGPGLHIIKSERTTLDCLAAQTTRGKITRRFSGISRR